MCAKSKSSTKSSSKSQKDAVIVSDQVGNYEKHPFFIKKANAAKNLIATVGLPKELTKKAHA